VSIDKKKEEEKWKSLEYSLFGIQHIERLGFFGSQYWENFSP
jgi:hypothetical protein